MQAGRRASLLRHIAQGWKELTTRHRQPLALLVAICLLAGLGWGAIVLTGEVLEGDTAAIDERLLLSMRVPGDPANPVGPGWVEEIGRDFTALGGVGVLSLVTLLVGGYLLLRGARRTLWFMLAAVGGGVLASNLLKHLFARPRPELVPHGSIVYTSSFPSGHSMMAATTYLTLAVLLTQVDPRRRVQLYFLGVAVLITMLVGMSRVYLGVHWPSDVLAGWTMGASWALLCWTVARALRFRGTLTDEIHTT